MLPAFISKNLYYLSLMLRGRYQIIKNYEFLREKSHENQETILKEQWERLHKILSYAYKEIPYYHRVFDENHVDLNNFTIEEFRKIPFLTKDIIRKEFNNLYKIRPGIKWYYHSTSGSTGEPITVIQDMEYFFWETAVKHLFDEWAFHKIGEPSVILWGPLLKNPNLLRKMRGKISNIFISNKKLLEPNKLSLDFMNYFIKIAGVSGTGFMLSYASGAYELALFAARNNLNVKPFKSIMTSAETLYPYMRETIERVFQCRVFDRYGSNEAGDVASECTEHKGLHISSYTHYVEVLKENGTPCKDGEQGEMVITILTNYTMPLIRYKIGDMAIKSDEKCTCGIGFPIIKDVTGRTQDFFIDETGNLIIVLAILNTFLTVYI
jgi:phenylacetate-CoA ligase